MPMVEQKCINIPQKLLQRVKADKHSLEGRETVQRCQAQRVVQLQCRYGCLVGKEL